MRTIENAGNLLEATFKNLSLGKAFAERKIIYGWGKIVGEEIAKRTLAKNIIDKVLYVSVNNSSWAHHLSMLKREIIKKINSYSCKNVVNEIIFRVGDLSGKADDLDGSDESDLNKKVVNISQAIELDAEQERLLNEKVCAVEDEELRVMFRRMLKKNYKLQKAREMVYNSRCEKCGYLCEDGEKVCLNCRLEQKKDNYHKLKNLLFHVPFLNFDICKKETHCTAVEYRLAKNELLEEFIKSYKEEEKDLYLDNMIMILYGKELVEPDLKLRASIKRRYVNSFFYKKQT